MKTGGLWCVSTLSIAPRLLFEAQKIVEAAEKSILSKTSSSNILERSGFEVEEVMNVVDVLDFKMVQMIFLELTKTKIFFRQGATLCHYFIMLLG